MDANPVSWLSTLLGPNGAVFLLLIFISGLIRRWWILGWQYDEVVKHRDMWESLATRNAQLADKSLSSAERTAPPQQ